MLVGIASIFGFRLFSSDVIQSYIQSAEELNRDIFLNPPKEFCLRPEQLIKLVKPLYGLTESGDYWGRTLRNKSSRKSSWYEILRIRLGIVLQNSWQKANCVYVLLMWITHCMQITRNIINFLKETEKTFQCKRS